MKTLDTLKSLAAALVLVPLAATAQTNQDITFTNKTATLTNLQGRIYTNVTLVKADLDGIVWSGDGMGRICFTNLSAGTLERFGIPTNRIAIAKIRAEHKGASDAQYRGMALLAAQQEREAQEKEAARAAAEAPLRARDQKAQEKAQQKDDATTQLTALQNRINALDRELRYTQAWAIDNGGSYSHQAVEQLNDLHTQLDRMAADYEKKFGPLPDGIETGMRWQRHGF